MIVRDALADFIRVRKEGYVEDRYPQLTGDQLVRKREQVARRVDLCQAAAATADTEELGVVSLSQTNNGIPFGIENARPLGQFRL